MRVHGPSIHSELFSIKGAVGRQKDYRLAVVVSKKIDNRAVVRNRIRRRIFEAVRTSGILSGQPVDVVIFVKSPLIAGNEYEQFSREVRTSLNKLLQRLHTGHFESS